MLSFIEPAIVLSIFMLSSIVVLVCGLFEWKRIWAIFFVLLFFLYINVLCIVFGDPIIIHQSTGWDSIYRFNPAALLCLSRARNWIFDVICRVVFVFNVH